jgi:hypothetical protein
MLQFKTENAAAKADADKLAWQTLDVSTLPIEMQRAYAAYRDAFTTAKQYREVFESLFAAGVVAPQGERAILGYRFGKLSYAFAPIKERSASAKLVNFATLARKS